MPYKPRMSEQEALRGFRQLPGFQLDHDGFGHKLMSPRGLVHLRGARVNDELFASETFGLVNISTPLRAMADGPVKTHRLPVDSDMMRAISGTEISEAVISKMSRKRRDQAVLAAISPTGIVVLDGAHRIHRLHRDGISSVQAMVLRVDALRLMRVSQSLQRPDGSWAPDDMVPMAAFEQVLRDSAAKAAELWALP